ncbi:oligopeptide transport system ATP-binding protein [Anaerovirgula multivorans]|uniref:Oligopeptide transport system ATP-binding protein n=2 Tax=Anaerovirgula multivorans TaxID=312168 RepID=A0A239G3P3_9FIRM|nr:oligopeptide transport system ATP-binding protein [Anaerovirgula multivorans]
MRLNPEPPARFKAGEIIFDEKDITKLKEKEMQKLRGSQISMIFQDPMTSLNPTMAIGKQIMEGLRRHRKVNHAEAKKVAIEMLRLVQIPNPEKRFKEYPHQFSGGMRQRAMIAIALVCNPQILIADEPTTALDVTIQAQILELMNDLRSKINTSIIMITHDLGVVAHMAQRVIVMYGGKIVETGSTSDIFYHSRHPYSWGLLSSVPRLDIKKKDGKLSSIEGTPPDLFAPPQGCPFADRCEYAMKICQQQMPPSFEINISHEASCWLNHPQSPSVEPPIFTKKNKQLSKGGA